MEPMTLPQFSEWLREKRREAELKKATASPDFAYYYAGVMDALTDAMLQVHAVSHPLYWVDYYARDAAKEVNGRGK